MEENEEKVLLALYSQINSGQKQAKVFDKALKLAEEATARAVGWLYSEDYISGVQVRFGEDEQKPFLVTVDNIALTGKGDDYIKQLLDLAEPLSKGEIRRRIIKRAENKGWADVAALAAASF
ncbi:MAG: hypothetical protein H6Q75_887 [Firmicutes bacterium]|nr:hypothetical protein [Bacillota bacterium]